MRTSLEYTVLLQIMVKLETAVATETVLPNFTREINPRVTTSPQRGSIKTDLITFTKIGTSN